MTSRLRRTRSGRRRGPIRILRRVQGASHMVETTYLPVMCNHCDDAPCMRVGGGAIRKRADGIVIIDPDKARGRKDIVKACPYKAIVWNDALQLPQIWIFDAHLLDWAGPARVVSSRALPMSSRRSSSMTPRWPRRPDARDSRYCDPTWARNPAWYSGLERWETCFVGGSVSVEAGGVVECVTDAAVALYVGNRQVAETVSDGFGDFRFDGRPGAAAPMKSKFDMPSATLGASAS